MRTSIIVWSTLSGAAIGIIADALIVGAGLIVTGGRPLPRWASAASLVALAIIPIVAALLGYLEGRLKAL